MLNPFRETLSKAGLEAMDRSSPFRAEADSALNSFRTLRADLERQVRRGDLTVKVAREQANDAAAQLRTHLLQKSEGYSPTPRVFLDRLVEASNARRQAKETLSLEGLQRETNRLLRLHLMEQQLQARAGEFEGRTFLRPISGGSPSPTLDSLLGYHQMTTDAGDEVGQEWVRRQLEGFRNRAYNEDDIRQIDLACDRPDRVNPRLVKVYVETLKGRTADEMESFVDRGLEDGDANVCIAAFQMARQEPDGPRLRWVRKVLSGLVSFPDAALTTLRALEAETRAADAEAARAQANFAIVRAEAEVNLDGVESPTALELDRAVKMQGKPLARPGEAIGLTVDRRGAIEPEEFAVFAGGLAH